MKNTEDIYKTLREGGFDHIKARHFSIEISEWEEREKHGLNYMFGKYPSYSQGQENDNDTPSILIQ